MKKKELIEVITQMIQYEAYTARIFDELHLLRFDVGMMIYNRDTACGKAFAALEILSHITGKQHDDIYDKSVEEATSDIKKAECNIIKLLDLAGFNGEAYYKIVKE
jgi:hypothetical protein